MASQEVDFCIHYALPISELFSIHCSIDKRLAPRSNSFLLKKAFFCITLGHNEMEIKKKFKNKYTQKKAKK
ncbi:hypothetical protein BpHYR1_053054 [Brachionus plicatilis]|uniref:Uncharacterized protein n=1 Tax=Brachionus plicatilis TaxID=10195 RepID=A0A3M7T0S5_BRAPC|nr:hypothetical protein BpHYR1_053054 [Brachionus plicatilis]